MKIGLLTQEYHLGQDRFGGIGRAFGKMAHWLAGQGHDVTVYLHARDESETEELPGLRVVRVAHMPLVHWRLQKYIRHLPRSIGGWLWHAEVNRALSDRIMHDYRAGRIEVLLASRGITAPALITGHLLPTVVRMQYSSIRKQRVEKRPISWLDRYLEWIERAAIRKATEVYATCHFTADYARSFTKRKISVIRTPMFELQVPEDSSLVQQRYQLPKNYLLYWGGMVRVKGIHVLAEALPVLLERDATAHMVVVGSRRYTHHDGRSPDDDLQALQRRYPERLMILPPLDPPELFAIIKKADVVVLPSVIDNLPNALLEAMYFGKLIVASRGASLDEMILHEHNGLLFTLGDSGALAEVMLGVATLNSDRREAMCARAASDVRTECSPDIVMQDVLNLCSRAIQRHRAERGNVPDHVSHGRLRGAGGIGTRP